MSLDPIIQTLRRVPMFAGLKPLQVTEILRRSDRIVYKAGDLIIAEGEAGDAAVLIVKGEAARVAGPLLTGAAEPVAEGSLVGELAMLTEIEHSSTVVARGNVRALRITRTALIEQIAADPALGEHFIAQLAERLHAMADELKRIDQLFDTLDATMPPMHLLLPAGPRPGAALH